ncbi:hypothetical protein GJ744_000677 [Endocarpon pusillum]|uniref:Uncharacterized protein n=1 Tax=Endocarpon pusillum TaxID=364733 RepID=A0A8H7AAC6_9EURO|nr:hypothetical protein GJ744_000677 [Endocarpon pusillum]
MPNISEDQQTIRDSVEQWSQGQQGIRNEVGDDFFFAQASMSEKHDELPQYILKVPANWSVTVKGETHADYRQVVTCFDQSQDQLAKFIGSGEGGRLEREVVSEGSTEEWIIPAGPELRAVVFQFGFYVGNSSSIQVPKVARTEVVLNPSGDNVSSLQVIIGTEDSTDNDNNDTILYMTFKPTSED